MARKRYTSEQIIGHLRQAEVMVGRGCGMEEVLREIGFGFRGDGQRARIHGLGELVQVRGQARLAERRQDARQRFVILDRAVAMPFARAAFWPNSRSRI